MKHKTRNQATVVQLRATSQKPRKWYSIAARGPKTGEVIIYDDIGGGFFSEGVTAKEFASDLRALGQLDRLDVRLNSYGGDVAQGLAIYRLLAEHPAKITVHVDGVAASIASAIAMAGDEIVMSEAATMMIHEAWGGMIGTAAEFEAYASVMRSHNETLAKLYSDRTGNPPEKIKEWMAAAAGNLGTWFDSGMALEAGFATTVAENVKIAAHGAPHGMAEAKAEFSKRLRSANSARHIDVADVQEYDPSAATETRALVARLNAMKLRQMDRPSAA